MNDKLKDMNDQLTPYDDMAVGQKGLKRMSENFSWRAKHTKGFQGVG